MIWTWLTAVSPLGSYFELLAEIPLVHLLLDDEERGIDLAMFSVKGPFQNPAIEPLAVESVAFGLTGICQIGIVDPEKYNHVATENIVP